jgi:hypothetical protein
MVDLKFTSGKTVRLKNVHHVSSINKNLVSGYLLCQDGYKIVFESNKFVISKFGNFVGKGYECGDCSAYPCQMFVIKLLTMFAMKVYQMFGIHDFVMLILVV